MLVVAAFGSALLLPDLVSSLPDVVLVVHQWYPDCQTPTTPHTGDSRVMVEAAHCGCIGVSGLRRAFHPGS